MGNNRKNRSLTMLNNTSLNGVIGEAKNIEVKDLKDTSIQEDKNTPIQEDKKIEIQEDKNTPIQEDKPTTIQEPKEKDWSKRSYNLKNTTIKALEMMKVMDYPVGTELQTILEEAIWKLVEEKKKARDK